MTIWSQAFHVETPHHSIWSEFTAHVSSPLEGDSVIEENTIRENVVKCPFLLKSQNDKSFHCSQNRQAQVSCKNDSFDTLQNKSQGKIENRPKTSTSAGRVSEEPSERHMTWRSSVFLLQLGVGHAVTGRRDINTEPFTNTEKSRSSCEVFQINHTLKK